MKPPGGGTDVLGDGGGEGDDVVLGNLLDFLDAGDVEGAAFADIPRRILGDDSGAGHRFDRGNLYLQPRFVLALVAPDATHLRMCVSLDHPSDSRSRGISRPLTAPTTVAASEPSENRSRATRCTSSTVTRSTPSSVSSR